MVGTRKTSKTEREVNKKSNLQLEFVNDSFARKSKRKRVHCHEANFWHSKGILGVFRLRMGCGGANNRAI